jgi:hypothetical protein
MTTAFAPAASSRWSRPFASMAALICLLLLSAIAMASSAEAKTGITEYKTIVSDTKAGGHPDIYIHGKWETHVSPPNAPCNCDDVRVITTNMPTGFIGNQHAVTTCAYAQFTLNQCSADSQLGAVYNPSLGGGYIPLYNLEAPSDQAGRLGFIVPLVSAPQLLNFAARTESDYGLTITTSQIFHILPVVGIDMWLWGVPADPIHDSARFRTPLVGTGACSPGISNPEYGGLEYPYPCPNITEASSTVPPVPLLQNPTTCGVPLTGSIELDYYNQVHTQAEYPWPATTGCDQLGFNPSLTTKTTTSQADTASGLDVDLKVPQTQSPTTPSPSEIQAVQTTLPVGFSINPNAADGKTSCTDPEGSFGTRDAASCPEHAKVGTLELDSSALPGPIFGAIYLGEPLPGNRYRIFLTADGFGTHVKLAGSANLDSETGRIQISFVNLPQSPFSRFNLHFFGSERGLMATPTQCGTYAVESDFTPWDNALPVQHLTSYFTIDSGPGGRPCPGKPRPFDPQLAAGTWNSTAGMRAPFTFQVTREDGEQNLSQASVEAPPGFSAFLNGIPYCSETALATLSSGYAGLAELANPACAGASQVGTAVIGAGAGTHPLYTPGKVYLAGPYKGAPLSLAAVVPAVSGPYDLGAVLVRIALRIDPVTAQVTADSDPLPQILEGIPLRLRSVMVNLDRSNFTVNPTNCSPFEFSTMIAGDEGAIAHKTAHFQASNCRNLDYAPKLSLELSGGLARRGHPAVHAVLRTGSDESNSRRVSVSLPPGEQLDNSHISTICTRVQFAADQCPAGSLIGDAEAQTPLLDQPLTGSVYLRSSTHELPDLVFDLHGQIDIELVGRINSTKDGALRTTFTQVPDAPVSRFELNLAGGSKGLLVNSENLCENPKRAKVKMTGQNGASLTRNPKLQTDCGSSGRHKRHKRHHHRTAG